MFREGEIQDVVFKPLKRFSDRRGWLIELYREDELSGENHPVMAYVSETQPGVARGPHFHHDQSDYFAFFGPGDFRLYLWDSRSESPSFEVRQTRIVGESNPQAVIVPPGVVHAYLNVSERPGLVFNSPNRLFAGEGKREPVDEIRFEEVADSPYVMD